MFKTKPIFTRQKQVNINVEDGSTPYSIFIQLFTDSLFKHIRVETAKYSVWNINFLLTIKELQEFFCNKYSNYTHKISIC